MFYCSGEELRPHAMNSIECAEEKINLSVCNECSEEHRQAIYVRF